MVTATLTNNRVGARSPVKRVRSTTSFESRVPGEISCVESAPSADLQVRPFDSIERISPAAGQTSVSQIEGLVLQRGLFQEIVAGTTNDAIIALGTLRRITCQSVVSSSTL